MIRRGKEQGSLHRPLSEFPAWAELYGATFHGVEFGQAGEGKGFGIIAARDLVASEEGPLMTLPRSLVLSRETVLEEVKVDHWLRDVFEAMAKADITPVCPGRRRANSLHPYDGYCSFLSATPRNAILVFLLHQMTTASHRPPNSTSEAIGVAGPFMDYVKFLPEELLPTLWTAEERSLLLGTSLEPALVAKHKSLIREFAEFRKATAKIPWCAAVWWSDAPGHLSFDDWSQVDAMYRSRALEFPGIGDAMVPCVDMANHVPDEGTAAVYEVDGDGNAVLLLREGVTVKKGEEVSITYGDEKGACEMLFSYGFIDSSMAGAKSIFVEIEALDDDPFAKAKMAVKDCAPGAKMWVEGGLKWESEWIYLVLMNEEDGLGFKVAQAVDGSRDLEMFWHDELVESVADWAASLRQDPRWDIYRLRAVAHFMTIVKEKRDLIIAQDVAHVPYGEGTGVRQRCWEMSVRLAKLEGDMLYAALVALELEMNRLLESEVVIGYMADVRREREELEAQERVAGGEGRAGGEEGEGGKDEGDDGEEGDFS